MTSCLGVFVDHNSCQRVSERPGTKNIEFSVTRSTHTWSRSYERRSLRRAPKRRDRDKMEVPLVVRRSRGRVFLTGSRDFNRSQPPPRTVGSGSDSLRAWSCVWHRRPRRELSRWNGKGGLKKLDVGKPEGTLALGDLEVDFERDFDGFRSMWDCCPASRPVALGPVGSPREGWSSELRR